MQKRYRFILTFLLCLCTAIVLFGLRETGIVQLLQMGGERIASPLRSTGYHFFSGFPWIGQQSYAQEVERRTTDARQRIDYETLVKDNQAFKDQFETGRSYTARLLPARVIGAPRFIPGMTTPETFIIDKGSMSAVKVGQGILVKDQVLGKVTQVSKTYAVVTLVTNPSFSLPVKTARTSALGIIRGTGNGEMLLDNVVLAEEIQKDDLVVSYGDVNEKGIGLPTGLTVGKIVSVDKKPSALFQTAKVQVLLPLGKVSLVFVALGEK